MKVFASLSGGKDSVAALLTHLEHGGVCDGAIYCRILFDDTTSAEFPEHEHWMHNTLFPTLERDYGVKTTIVQSEKSYIDCFYRTRGEKNKRAGRKTVEGKTLPLVEHGITEQGAFELCRQHGLLSPAYNGGRTRLGCWFCHNQRIGELCRLRFDYPVLWDKLLKLDRDSPVKFTPRCTVADLDRRFELEGLQQKWF